MAAPDLDDVTAYISSEGSWTADQIGAALLAEKASQATRCRVPADDAVWPEDLAEGLRRRVLRNLVMRALPLGLSTTMSEATVSVTRIGMDAEITRFEAPYRKMLIG